MSLSRMLIHVKRNRKLCIRPDSGLDSRLGSRSEGIGQTTFAAILTVLVESHEDTSAALRILREREWLE
jgi:hypothetical protein